MKSAYELALERSGGAVQKLDGRTKAVIAEIEKKYQARIAAVELGVEQRLAAIEDLAGREKLEAAIRSEIASLHERCEREKTAARTGQGRGG